MNESWSCRISCANEFSKRVPSYNLFHILVSRDKLHFKFKEVVLTYLISSYSLQTSTKLLNVSEYYKMLWYQARITERKKRTKSSSLCQKNATHFLSVWVVFSGMVFCWKIESDGKLTLAKRFMAFKVTFLPAFSNSDQFSTENFVIVYFASYVSIGRMSKCRFSESSFAHNEKQRERRL